VDSALTKAGGGQQHGTDANRQGNIADKRYERESVCKRGLLHRWQEELVALFRGKLATDLEVANDMDNQKPM
jgi:hypothetical protein